MADAVKPGDVLAGRFRIEEPLGAGGFGSIWRAHHEVLDAPVALKLMDPEIAKDPEARERFMREARAAANLRGQNVVQILDYGVEGELAFIVMELLEGEDLGKRIKRLGPLEPDAMIRIFTQVCRAVTRAHAAGIIHRDLKPANVFLVRAETGHDEEDELAKVLDFGVAKVEGAKLTDAGAPTRTGSLIGTPHYMSPEQLQGNKTIDHRSDLWSLGVIVFEALTGKLPFASEGLGDLVLQICVREPPVPSHWARVPRGLDAWMAKALAREPQSRFQSAKEMAGELKFALTGENAELVGEDTTERPGDGGPKATLGLTPTVADTGRAAEASPAPTSNRKKKKEKRALDVPAESRTVAQFGTSRETPPPPSRARTVQVVAGLALAAGIAGGYVVMKQGEADVRPPYPAPVPAATAAEASAIVEDDAAVAEDAAAVAARDAALEPEAAAAKDPEPEAEAETEGPVATPKAHEEWRPKVVNGKVVKPSWAVPDPEPEPPPPLPPPPDDPSSDNPY